MNVSSFDTLRKVLIGSYESKTPHRPYVMRRCRKCSFALAVCLLLKLKVMCICAFEFGRMTSNELTSNHGCYRSGKKQIIQGHGTVGEFVFVLFKIGILKKSQGTSILFFAYLIPLRTGGSILRSVNIWA